MKKFSERGAITLITMVALAIGVIAIMIVNNIQDVQSQEWQKENRIVIVEE